MSEKPPPKFSHLQKKLEDLFLESPSFLKSTQFQEIQDLLQKLHLQQVQLETENSQLKKNPSNPSTSLETTKNYKQQFRSIIEHSIDFIGMVDTTGKLIYINPAGKKMIGLEENDDSTSLDVSDFHSKPSINCILQEGLPRSIQDGIWQSESFLLKKNGEEIPISQICICHKDSAGNPEFFSTIIRDISRDRQFEAQLRQSQKMEAIGTLTGGIAHEFNNILAVIMGYTQMSMLEVPKNSPFLSNLEKIYEGGNRARELVEQLITFSRSHQEKSCILYLNSLLKETIKLLIHTMPSTITFHQNIQNCSPVMADPTQIHQLFINLCNNARQALENDFGKIEITLKDIHLEKNNPNFPHVEGDYVVIVIQDNGCGMTSEIQKRVFEPFFTTKKIGKGTGLGLSVVHGIVQTHKGHISIESELGKGTTVTVLFPVSKRDSHKVEKTIAIQRGSEHILVVDDEEALVKLYESFLLEYGYKVTTARDGQEALEKFQANPEQFDLVLTDQTMPYMTGKQLAIEILKCSPHTPIILATGYREVISNEKSQSSGISKCVLKPIELSKLMKIVQELLSKFKC